jgi:hypothetical protein
VTLTMFSTPGDGDTYRQHVFVAANALALAL